MNPSWISNRPGLLEKSCHVMAADQDLASFSGCTTAGNPPNPTNIQEPSPKIQKNPKDNEWFRRLVYEMLGGFLYFLSGMANKKNGIKESDANGCPWGHHIGPCWYFWISTKTAVKSTAAFHLNFHVVILAAFETGWWCILQLHLPQHRQSTKLDRSTVLFVESVASFTGLPTSVWITPQAWMYSRPFNVCLASKIRMAIGDF